MLKKTNFKNNGVQWCCCFVFCASPPAQSAQRSRQGKAAWALATWLLSLKGLSWFGAVGGDLGRGILSGIIIVIIILGSRQVGKASGSPSTSHGWGKPVLGWDVNESGVQHGPSYLHTPGWPLVNPEGVCRHRRHAKGSNGKQKPEQTLKRPELWMCSLSTYSPTGRTLGLMCLSTISSPSFVGH